MATCTDPSITMKELCVGVFNATGDLCAYMPTLAEELTCKASIFGSPFPRLWQTYYSQVRGENRIGCTSSVFEKFVVCSGCKCW